MKPRKVMVYLELKSNISTKDLRAKCNWQVMLNRFFDKAWGHKIDLHQVSVQVVKETK